jgi:hypothetical protein
VVAVEVAGEFVSGRDRDQVDPGEPESTSLRGGREAHTGGARVAPTGGSGG